MNEEFIKALYKNFQMYFPKQMTYEIFKVKFDETWEQVHGED